MRTMWESGAGHGPLRSFSRTRRTGPEMMGAGPRTFSLQVHPSDLQHGQARGQRARRRRYAGHHRVRAHSVGGGVQRVTVRMRRADQSPPYRQGKTQE